MNASAPLRVALRTERLARFSPLILGLVALLAILYFDFGPPLPFNDDWGYAWEAQHTGLGGIQLFPTAQATAFVQAVWGQLATLGHPQEPYLRLSILPFVVLASASSYRIARNLDADRVWSGVAAVALLTTPVYLNLATSFMSDVPYIALALAATDAGVRWVRSGQSRWQFLLWTALATLQRQLGLGLPVALTLSLVLGWRRRRPTRGDAVWLAALWAVVILILAAPDLLDIRTPMEQYQEGNLTILNWDFLTRGIGFLPAMLGMFLLPFAVGVLFQSRQPGARPRFSRWSLVTFTSLGLGAIGIYAAVSHLTSGDYPTGKQAFVGNIWTILGFLPSSTGNKPQVFSDGVWLGIGLVAVASSVVLLVVGARTWGRLARQPAALFLMLAATVQVGEVVNAYMYDRYLLVPAALLVPLMAAAASRSTRERLALGWAIASGIAGVGLYAVAQQDSEAWQAARDQAVHFAYRFAAPDAVYAGYEPMATYVVVPAYEQNGSLDLASTLEFLIVGPSQPRLSVYFSGPNDPRPGVPYDSVAPGKMVVVGALPPGAGSP